MPKIVTATGASKKVPYLPTAVPPAKARKKQMASGKKSTSKKSMEY